MAPPSSVCLFLPPSHYHQGGLELPAGKPSGAPHRKFMLQERPIKWLMDSMRHNAGVKGAGGNERERCVKGERTGPGKELGSAVSRPSSGLCCSLKQAGTALVVGLFQRPAAVCIQRGN